MIACARCKIESQCDNESVPIRWGYVWADEKFRAGQGFTGTRTVWNSGFLCPACWKVVRDAAELAMQP